MEAIAETKRLPVWERVVIGLLWAAAVSWLFGFDLEGIAWATAFGVPASILLLR
jgi:hypothetical protein